MDCFVCCLLFCVFCCLPVCLFGFLFLLFRLFLWLFLLFLNFSLDEFPFLSRSVRPVNASSVGADAGENVGGGDVAVRLWQAVKRTLHLVQTYQAIPHNPHLVRTELQEAFERLVSRFGTTCAGLGTSGVGTPMPGT